MGPDRCYISHVTAKRKKSKVCRKLFPNEKTEVVRIVRSDIAETERENKIHTILSLNLLKHNNLFTNLISNEYNLKRQQLASDKTFSELVELAVQCTDTVFARELNLTIQPLMHKYFEDLRRSSEELLKSLNSSNNVINCVLEEDVLNITDDKIISTHIDDLSQKNITSEEDNLQVLNKIKLSNNFISQQNGHQLPKAVSRKPNLEESQLSKKLLSKSDTFPDAPLPKVVRAKLNPEKELQSDVPIYKGDDVPTANKICKKQNYSQLCKVGIEEINLEKGLQANVSTLKKDGIHSVNKISKEENMLPLSLIVSMAMSQRIEHNTEYKLSFMEYATLNLQDINISNMQGVSVALTTVLKSLDNFIKKNEKNKCIHRAKILKMAIISLL